MDIEGSHIIQLFTGVNQNEFQRYSPDGKTIVYSYYGNQIHTINVDGTDDKRLITSGSTIYDIKYNYDGTKILFTSYISPNHFKKAGFHRPSINALLFPGLALIKPRSSALSTFDLVPPSSHLFICLFRNLTVSSCSSSQPQ